MAGQDEKKLQRQFDAFARAVPPSRKPIERLLEPRWRWVRMPLAIALIVGGFFAVLPVFGLWMIPLGLLVLALDVPPLQPHVVAGSIRTRRQIRLWQARLRERKRRRRDES
jgi:hypothetical protein